MESKIQFFVIAFSFLFSCSNAFNITSLLDQYPSFSTFNNYLTQTQLAGTINSRQTITVLVVSNDAISSLSGKPQDVLKKILSVHVILDYFDIKMLETLPNKTQSLVTLFQASGQAIGQQGFLNATDSSTGSVVIGSAGATDANVVKSIAAEPYNISVLQISTVINPFEVGNSSTNTTSNTTSPSSAPVLTTYSPTVSPTPVPGPVPMPGPVPVPVILPVPVVAPAYSPRKALSPSPTPANANSPGLSPTPTNLPWSYGLA